jgi:hypothetical protein
MSSNLCNCSLMSIQGYTQHAFKYLLDLALDPKRAKCTGPCQERSKAENRMHPSKARLVAPLGD